MNEQIDWSKAPDDAMVLLKHLRDDSYAWAVSHSEDARAWHKWNIKCSFHLMASEWSVVAERPTTPSWSVEGLPPVGVVCEANFVGEWRRFELRYYGEAYVVFKTASEVQRTRHSFDTCGVKFRPIRTPEQIAADEREVAIEQIEDIISGFSYRHCAELIHDAGYRKAEVNDAV